MTPGDLALQSTTSFTKMQYSMTPKGGIFRGRDEIDRIAGVIKATHPDFEYQPLFPPEELGDGGRVRWVSGTPGKPPAYAGTDFIVARNGRIASVYLFFDSLPWAELCGPRYTIVCRRPVSSKKRTTSQPVVTKANRSQTRNSVSPHWNGSVLAYRAPRLRA